MAGPESKGDWDRAPFFRRFTYFWFNIFGILLRRYRVTGLEHVPLRGPVIVAANHVSVLDGPLLAMAVVPSRYLTGLGKKELFEIPVLSWFLRNNGYVPLDRSGDIGAMRWSVDLLKSGGCMQIFPEGTRSKDGKPGKPKAGLGFIAGKTGAPVVPARVVNSDKYLTFSRLEVRFGAPMRFDGDAGDRDACLAFGQRVLDRIFSL